MFLWRREYRNILKFKECKKQVINSQIGIVLCSLTNSKCCKFNDGHAYNILSSLLKLANCSAHSTFHPPPWSADTCRNATSSPSLLIFLSGRTQSFFYFGGWGEMSGGVEEFCKGDVKMVPSLRYSAPEFLYK